MLTGIAFYVYPVSDMARARRFYEEVLDLKVESNFGDEWIEYGIGGGTFAITTEVMRRFGPVRTAIAVDLGPIHVGPRRAVDRGAGLCLRKRLLDREPVGDVELRPRKRHGRDARALGSAYYIAPEHPAGARHEQPEPAHSIEMSELSPTMKRYARGWRSPRRTLTSRPSSDDSMRPSRSRTLQPASRIECSTSEREIVHRSPIAV